MTQQNPIFKCAKCNVALKGPIDPKPDDRVACPICGEGDRFEQVMLEIGEHVAEQAGESLVRGISDQLRGNKHIKITKNLTPKKPHRFIVDLDLH